LKSRILLFCFEIICYSISFYRILLLQKLPFWTFCNKDTVSLVSRLYITPITNRVTQTVTPKRPVSLSVTFSHLMSYWNSRRLRFFLNSHKPHILLSIYNKYWLSIKMSLTLSVLLKFRGSQPLSFYYRFVTPKLLITEDNFSQSVQLLWANIQVNWPRHRNVTALECFISVSYI